MGFDLSCKDLVSRAFSIEKPCKLKLERCIVLDGFKTSKVIEWWGKFDARKKRVHCYINGLTGRSIQQLLRTTQPCMCTLIPKSDFILRPFVFYAMTTLLVLKIHPINVNRFTIDKTAVVWILMRSFDKKVSFIDCRFSINFYTIYSIFIKELFSYRSMDSILSQSKCFTMDACPF